MKPKLVIFDCDGVIVDSERLSNQVIRDDLATRGLDMTLEETMAAFVGGTIAGVAVQAADMGADIPDDWVAQLYAKMYDVLSREVELIPGVVGVLDALDQANIPYGIGSNGGLDKMEITLGRTGILSRFEGRMYSGKDMPAPKPAPDVYLHAAQKAGIDPKDCVVVEDSASGAKAGVAAGMRTLGFTHDTAPEVLRNIVDEMFNDMSELPALLGLSAS